MKVSERENYYVLSSIPVLSDERDERNQLACPMDCLRTRLLACDRGDEGDVGRHHLVAALLILDLHLISDVERVGDG